MFKAACKKKKKKKKRKFKQESVVKVQEKTTSEKWDPKFQGNRISAGVVMAQKIETASKFTELPLHSSLMDNQHLEPLSKA